MMLLGAAPKLIEMRVLRWQTASGIIDSGGRRYDAPRRWSCSVLAFLPFAVRGRGVRARSPITIAASSNSLAYGGMKIALEAGLFEKNGLAAEGRSPWTAAMPRSRRCCRRFGRVLRGRRGRGPGRAVRGQEIVIVTNIYRGLSGSLVLAKIGGRKPGRPRPRRSRIELKALDGLAIATPSATSAYPTRTRAAPRPQGARPSFVYMTQPAMVAALQVGAMQGISAGAPFSPRRCCTAAGVLWISGPKGELPAHDRPTSSACIETSEDYAAAHPDIIAPLQASFTAVARLIHARTARPRPSACSPHAYPSLDAATIHAVFRDEAPNWAPPRS